VDLFDHRERCTLRRSHHLQARLEPCVGFHSEVVPFAVEGDMPLVLVMFASHFCTLLLLHLGIQGIVASVVDIRGSGGSPAPRPSSFYRSSHASSPLVSRRRCSIWPWSPSSTGQGVGSKVTVRTPCLGLDLLPVGLYVGGRDAIRSSCGQTLVLSQGYLRPCEKWEWVTL
jgi:hypothetical protein